jgi:FAD:protein FMN transferase
MKINTGVTLIILLAITLFQVSCRNEPSFKIIRLMGETQGTYYSVSYVLPDSINYQLQIDSLLHRFDSSVSTYKPNSIISRLNGNDTSLVADETYLRIFRRAIEVSEATSGAFDITVGPLVNAWGFGFEGRMKVDQHIVDSLLPLIGFKKVRLEKGKLFKEDPRIRIDFNAIAQGYAVDVVSGFLESKGINAYLIDIGGEVFAKGRKPGGEQWNVGIEKPAANMDDEREVEDIVGLENMALSTSGNYRKFYEENGVRYSHTIDPSTGYPVKHSLLSVSVLATDCMTADAYATAFMVMGLDKAKQYLSSHKGLDAYFISSGTDGKMDVFYTDGFKVILQKK